MVLLAGCGDCLNVDCYPYRDASFDFAITINGQPIDLEDGQILTGDDISLRLNDDIVAVSYPSAESFTARLRDNQLYTLQLGALDTFLIVTQLTEIDTEDKCCPAYAALGINIDGTEVCQDSCGVISIDI